MCVEKNTTLLSVFLSPSSSSSFFFPLGVGIKTQEKERKGKKNKKNEMAGLWKGFCRLKLGGFSLITQYLRRTSSYGGHSVLSYFIPQIPDFQITPDCYSTENSYQSRKEEEEEEEESRGIRKSLQFTSISMYFNNFPLQNTSVILS